MTSPNEPSCDLNPILVDTVALLSDKNVYLIAQKRDIGHISLLQHRIMDQTYDDDATLSRHARRHSREFLHDRFKKRPPTSWWHRCAWLLDFLTSPRFGVMTAVLVIVGMHYKTEISTFVSSLVENGLKETLLDYMLAICDLARAYYQVAREVVRSLFSSWGARRSVSLFHEQSTQVSNGSHIPPLIMCAETHEAVGGVHIQNSTSRVMDASGANADFEQVTIHFEDIQPAFLNDEDYPKGWLTYHRVLGVVSKHEADEYNLKNSG